jgi:hypothetical protein
MPDPTNTNTIKINKPKRPKGEIKLLPLLILTGCIAVKKNVSTVIDENGRVIKQTIIVTKSHTYGNIVNKGDTIITTPNSITIKRRN